MPPPRRIFGTASGPLSPPPFAGSASFVAGGSVWSASTRDFQDETLIRSDSARETAPSMEFQLSRGRAGVA